MSGGAQRLAAALSAEDITADKLRAAGWTVTRFGQGLLPKDFRDALQRFKFDGGPTLLRWIPDLLAYRRFGKHMLCLLLDVKSDNPRYQNYAIEIKSLDAAKAYRLFNIPCWFIIDNNLHILTPDNIDAHCRPGPPNWDGSGTPYVLIDKSHAIPLDDAVTSLLSSLG